MHKYVRSPCITTVKSRTPDKKTHNKIPYIIPKKVMKCRDTCSSCSNFNRWQVGPKTQTKYRNIRQWSWNIDRKYYEISTAGSSWRTALALDFFFAPLPRTYPIMLPLTHPRATQIRTTPHSAAAQFLLPLSTIPPLIHSSFALTALQVVLFQHLAHSGSQPGSGSIPQFEPLGCPQYPQTASSSIDG